MENYINSTCEDINLKVPLTVLSNCSSAQKSMALQGAQELGSDVITGVQFGIAPLEAVHQAMEAKGIGLRLWVRLQEHTHDDCNALIVASARILASTQAALAGDVDSETMAGLYQALNFIIQSGLAHDMIANFPAPKGLCDAAWIHGAAVYSPVVVWRPAYILAALIEQEEARKIDADDSPPAKLHPAQEKAMQALQDLMKARFSGAKAAGIKPHCHGLILGSSGSGKSFLARELAKRSQTAFKGVTVGSWLLVGNDRPHATLTDIGRWINGLKTSQKGILFIDEIDKMQATNQDNHNAIYVRSCFDELLALLDGRPESPTWSSSTRTRLQRDVFIAAAGAFQSLYQAEGDGKVVLEEEWTEAFIQDKVWEAGILPDELLMRLAPGVTEIPPPSADWLAQRLLAIDVELLGQPRFDDQGYRKRASKMVLSRRNLRSLEAYLLETWRFKQASLATDPEANDQPGSAQN